MTTQTTLVISGPEGVAKNKLSHRLVSLIDLYPTLVELCGLPPREGLDGQSIVPLLKDPQIKWDRPALSTYGNKNHTVRTERWRYIQYNDGGEELYDHDIDPNEWTNLANISKFDSIKTELKKLIPTINIR